MKMWHYGIAKLWKYAITGLWNCRNDKMAPKRHEANVQRSPKIRIKLITGVYLNTCRRTVTFYEEKGNINGRKIQT